MRLRDELRREEQALRELLCERLWRGRVEVSVEVAAIGRRDVEVSLEREVASAIKTLADDLAADGLIAGGPYLGDLLRLPELVRLEVRDPEWTAADRAVLLRVTADALEQLIAARSEAGEKISAVRRGRIETLQRLASELATDRQRVVSALAAGLRRRVAELLADEAVDENRLAQEVAYLVDRSDVSEELDRLQSHFEHFRSILSQDGSIGKRLDFLIQEIFRELNTLGSKCRDSAMTRRVLDAKVVCEQLREQIQNVE